MLHLNCGLDNEASMYVVSSEHLKCLSKPHEAVGITFLGKLMWPVGSQAVYRGWAFLTRAIAYKLLDKPA